jgi:hypothetical protein
MSIFDSLGDALNVPQISTAAQSVVGETASQIGGYVAQNFNLPNISQKAAELGNKLSLSGLSSNFQRAVVNDAGIQLPTASALNGLFAPPASGDFNGVPSNLVPSSGSENTAKLKVVIRQSPAVGDINEIVFSVMPKIDESRSADYEAITPVHHPGAIMKYRNTSARTWRVSGRLISRTMEEATHNVKVINMIRSWLMPFHGVGTANNMTTAEMLGAPPPILTLSGYGPNMIGPVKCVLKDHNWTWDNTLDWMPTNDGQSFPVILDVSLSLEESWSPAEFSGFDLVKFKAGDLSSSGAFTKPVIAAREAGAGRGFVNRGDVEEAVAPVTSAATAPGAGAGRGFVNPTLDGIRSAAANVATTTTAGGAAVVYRNIKRRTSS